MKYYFPDSPCSSKSRGSSTRSASHSRMTHEEAIAFIKEKRPKANPNEGFIKQLKDFEVELNSQKLKMKPEKTRRSRFTPYYTVTSRIK